MPRERTPRCSAGSGADLELLARVRLALARLAALQLAAFKRMLKANGFTEAGVHEIIPDRG